MPWSEIRVGRLPDSNVVVFKIDFCNAGGIISSIVSMHEANLLIRKLKEVIMKAGDTPQSDPSGYRDQLELLGGGCENCGSD